MPRIPPEEKRRRLAVLEALPDRCGWKEAAKQCEMKHIRQWAGENYPDWRRLPTLWNIVPKEEAERREAILKDIPPHTGWVRAGELMGVGVQAARVWALKNHPKEARRIALRNWGGPIWVEIEAERIAILNSLPDRCGWVVIGQHFGRSTSATRHWVVFNYPEWERFTNKHHNRRVDIADCVRILDALPDHYGYQGAARAIGYVTGPTLVKWAKEHYPDYERLRWEPPSVEKNIAILESLPDACEWRTVREALGFKSTSQARKFVKKYYPSWPRLEYIPGMPQLSWVIP